MASSAQPASSTAIVQDNVSTYRLKKEVLEEYLAQKFPVQQHGNIDFNVQVVPHPLTGAGEFVLSSLVLACDRHVEFSGAEAFD